MSEPIRFYKGEETRIIKEHYSEIEHSLFKGQYYKALNEIGMFLNANSGKDNNIFAFLGDRGTGKTSCMESVAQILMDIDENTKRDENIEESNQNIIAKKNFLVLDFIDPTTFNDDTNIMDVVIGTLFEEFKRYVTNNCSKPCGNKDDDYERKKHSVLVKFQEVRRCIKYIGNTKCLYEQDDDISQMSDLSSVVKLKSLIKELTDAYLEFFKKDVLVIKVDDVDLQTKYAYTMVDQIRKYFMHENIIILMAVKIEQLSYTIQLENAKNYKELLDRQLLTNSAIIEMAARYLLKLIPIGHRISMPTFEFYAKSPLEYYEVRDDSKPEETWTSIKYVITELIFKKCRFLFYHSKGTISPIVPRKLRERRHLFAMLYTMDDFYKEGMTVYNHQKENQLQFLNYLNTTWVQNNINAIDYRIVENLLDVKDAANINKIVLRLLKDKYNDSILSKTKHMFEVMNQVVGDEQVVNDEKEIDLFSEILEQKNVSYNISIADVFVVLNFIKQRVSSSSDKMLVFFIETYYSIKLYNYYNEMTPKADANEKSEKEQQLKYELEINELIRNREAVDNFSNYEILVGGSFLNTEYISLLPIEQSTKLPRDRREISLDKLKQYAQEAISEPGRNQKKLQLVEFFALGISRLLDAQGKKVNDLYRMNSELYYDFSYRKTHKKALFDLGSFFFNIVNIERAYNRIHPQLFDTAIHRGESLLVNILESCMMQRDEYTKGHALLSCTAIRNYEILNDFVYRIQFNKFKRSPSSSNVNNLKRFFNLVAIYNIKIYDKHENPYYKIDEVGQSVKEEDFDIDEMNLDTFALYDPDFYDKNILEATTKSAFLPNLITFKYAKEVSKVLSNIDDKLFDSVFSEGIVYKDGKKAKKARKVEVKIDFAEFIPKKIMEIMPKAYEFALYTFKRRVRECCKTIFAKRPEVKQAWNSMSIFKGDLRHQRIDRQQARIILEEFKQKYNL
ncbi:MAG: hypothetical protein MJ009_03225 [Paludibacteraceae bacterium]|nr:hypothetical protein [Paludibacteraceae bacterium]